MHTDKKVSGRLPALAGLFTVLLVAAACFESPPPPSGNDTRQPARGNAMVNLDSSLPYDCEVFVDGEKKNE